MSAGRSSRQRADQSASARSAPRRSSSVASAPSSRSTGVLARRAASGEGVARGAGMARDAGAGAGAGELGIEAPRSAQPGAAAQVEAQRRLGGAREADAHAVTHGAAPPPVAADPQLT